MGERRIAIIIKNPGFLRYIQTQIEMLCKRGHDIHIGIHETPFDDQDGLLAALSSKYPGITVGHAAPRRDQWKAIANSLRDALDYCRYLHPDFSGADGLRRRAEIKAAPLGRALSRLMNRFGLDRSRHGVRYLLRALRAMHSALPPDPKIVAYLSGLDVGLVLMTGLVWPRSPQADYILACRKLGVPTGYVVNSWDNLTNKGDIKALPDEVYVWNAEQRREAIRFHGMDGGAVQVTGAPLFDRWFEREATESRADFCRRVGLPDDAPFVLYACSSPRIAPRDTEPGFFRAWWGKVRSSRHAAIVGVNILVRPHPFNAGVWRDFSVDDPQVAVYPTHGRWVVQEDDRDNYYNALHYCAAVVGINTSAMVEAAIAGAQTFTIENGEFDSAQGGTLHFRYLTSLGIVDAASTIKGNIAALAKVLETPARERQPLPGVVQFVRPKGVETSSTGLAVAAIERQMAGGRSRRYWLSQMWRPVLVCALGYQGALRQVQARLEKASAQQDMRKFFARRVFPKVLSLSLKMLPAESHVLASAVRNNLPSKELKRFALVEDDMLLASKGTAPIFVGPWISEVGFEVLYWIPFLRWYISHYKIPEDRIVIISRGGPRSWYDGICGRYFDVFDIFPPGEFREENHRRATAQRGRQKQYDISAMERGIYENVAHQLGIKKYRILHPAIMFRLFDRYWRDTDGFKFIEQYTRYQPILFDREKIRELCPGLPERYVAVKFYARESLENTEENRDIIAGILRRLASRTDVVLLNTNVRVDDHADFDIGSPHRVHVVNPMLDPAQNLEVQTAVIAGAEAYVGTYGGMTYVANLLGKTTISFEEHGVHNRPTHTELASRALRAFGGSLYVINTNDLEYFELILGGAIGGPARAPEELEEVRVE